MSLDFCYCEFTHPFLWFKAGAACTSVCLVRKKSRLGVMSRGKLETYSFLFRRRLLDQTRLPRATRKLLWQGTEGLTWNIRRLVTLLHDSFHNRLSLELPSLTGSKENSKLPSSDFILSVLEVIARNLDFKNIFSVNVASCQEVSLNSDSVFDSYPVRFHSQEEKTPWNGVGQYQRE